jgi:hypothetical protein
MCIKEENLKCIKEVKLKCFKEVKLKCIKEVKLKYHLSKFIRNLRCDLGEAVGSARASRA